MFDLNERLTKSFEKSGVKWQIQIPCFKSSHPGPDKKLINFQDILLQILLLTIIAKIISIINAIIILPINSGLDRDSNPWRHEQDVLATYKIKLK